jgi:hypothetical protein
MIRSKDTDAIINHLKNVIQLIEKVKINNNPSPGTFLTMQQRKQQAVEEALIEGNNIEEAAKLLDIPERSMYRYLKSFGLSKKCVSWTADEKRTIFLALCNQKETETIEKLIERLHQDSLKNRTNEAIRIQIYAMKKQLKTKHSV